jgi:hypothetical protein
MNSTSGVHQRSTVPFESWGGAKPSDWPTRDRGRDIIL